MAETVRGVSALQSELEKAKESLKDVDENIKKLTGRDPTIQRTPQRRVSLGASEPVGRGGDRTVGVDSRLFSLARRGIIQDGGSPSVQRRVGGAFSRLGPRPGGRPRDRQPHDSGDEDELPNKPTLQSSVIATPKEERSRQNSIEEQSRDRKGQARNRRMFGLLLGTLQKFKDESKNFKEKEEQRVQIEKKLEEKFKHEKEEIIKERRQLYNERRKKQLTIKLLEQKMEMAKNHEKWEVETRKLENFIRTKAKPHLFFMPKTLTAEAESKLKDTKKIVDDMIESRRKKLEEEIAEMMSQVEGDGKEGEEGDASMGEEGSDVEGAESDEGHTGDRLQSSASVSHSKHGDDKENAGRERHASGKEEVLSERQKRDMEREQRDRQLREERKGRGGEVRRRDQRERSGGRERDRSGEHKEGRGRDHRRDHHKSGETGDSRSRERDHRSGKSKSEKRGRDSDDEKSKSHTSKSKRRSKDGKTKEKAWEPMEDEEEEEFVGSKGSEKDGGVGGDIESKMLAMAGMSGITKTDQKEKDERAVDFSVDTSSAVEDIPEPGEPSDIVIGQDSAEKTDSGQSGILEDL